MGKNNYYLKDFYNQVVTKVPVLLEYQFLVHFASGANATANTGQDLFAKYPSLQDLTLVCQSAAIPKRTLSVTEVKYFAKRFSLPATEKFEHKWSTSIICTQGMNIYSDLRQFLLEFSNLKHNSGGIRTIPNLDIEVQILDQFSETTASPRFVLVGAFPNNVAAMELKYTDSDATPMTISVDWTYQYSFIDPLKQKFTADPLKNVAPIV